MSIIPVHDRYIGKGLKYITVQDHLATQHKYAADWNLQKFMSTASAIGEIVEAYKAKILTREVYPEHSYKS